ncbi:hypothetical protein CYMTET_53889, partial [Cymbomonas tetramitiformis]
ALGGDGLAEASSDYYQDGGRVPVRPKFRGKGVLGAAVGEAANEGEEVSGGVLQEYVGPARTGGYLSNVVKPDFHVILGAEDHGHIAQAFGLHNTVV